MQERSKEVEKGWEKSAKNKKKLLKYLYVQVVQLVSQNQKQSKIWGSLKISKKSQNAFKTFKTPTSKASWIFLVNLKS